MKQIKLTPEELRRLLRVLWRVIATIILAEITGMIVGFIIKPYQMLFFNLWYGAVYAAPIGYLLGLIWLRISEPGRITEEKIPLAVLGFMLIFVAVNGYFFSFSIHNFRRI